MSSDNAGHYCLNCTTYLGYRGFCNKFCHDLWYDECFTAGQKNKGAE